MSEAQPAGRIYRAQIIPLDLTAAQRVYMAKAAGTAKVAYNWALAEWKRQAQEWWDSGKRTPFPSVFALQKQFNAVKHTEYPWISEVAAQVTESAIFAVSAAFEAFRARDARYPRFKSRGTRRSFVAAPRRRDIHADGRRLRLPRVGAVRLGCAMRWPADNLVSATISERAGRWCVSLTFDIPAAAGHQMPTSSAGVDLGIKTPLVATCGEVTLKMGDGLSARLNVERRKLRRANKRLHRRVKGSGRRCRARQSVARIHQRLSNIRADVQHKSTCQVSRMASTVGVETLAVRNMMKNGRLARSIADVGFFEIKRQLKYKAEHVVEADRFYPSSKTCSSCGSIKQTLKLSDRTYHCDECGFECDRDVNAARNLERMAANCAVSARGDGSSARKRKLTLRSLSAKREALVERTIDRGK